MFAPSMTMMRYDEFLVHTSSDVNGGNWWRFTPASMDMASAKSSMITDTAFAPGLFRGCAGSAGVPGLERGRRGLQALSDTWPRCASHLWVPIQPVTTFVTGAAGLFGSEL